MLALAVAAAVTPAYAQSDNENAQSGLEVIEITSQHRTENVQKAALAVSAISTKQL